MILWIILQLLLVAVASHSYALPEIDESGVGSWPMCSNDERAALLAFNMGFSITTNTGFCYNGSVGYAKTESWEKENCCEWDGVRCDFLTGHVVVLDLSCSLLTGSFPSNNTLSPLRYLRHVNLDYNSLTGLVPRWIFTLPTLNSLFLFQNLFSGIEEFELGINGSSLTQFDVESNRLRGQIPDSIFDLSNLQYLDLERNGLTGTIPFSRITKLQNLQQLFLSDNSLTIVDDIDVDSAVSWPEFVDLGLNSCNLGHFPGFVRKLVNLERLELTNNGIHGLVPDWFLDIGVTSLRHLILDFNSFSGGLEHFPWKSIETININHNLFQGGVPVAPPTTNFFSASNNQLTRIPASLCGIGALNLLDLSQNNLTGNIPDCFASLIGHNLSVLDLGQNQLRGVIPSFKECPNLRTLSLSGNKLEGPIPQSLIKCLSLQLLDLSSNNHNDTFPHWLGVLPALEVLILGSNNFHGSLLMKSNNTNSFSTLRILDISTNYFTGSLPCNLLMSMKAMSKVNNNESSLYMGISFPDNLSSFYRESIMAKVKGITRRLDEIFNMLVFIDASWNRLQGPIPNAIGDLISLRLLNLAHNNFTGHIPPSLSNLTLLEALDMSSNRLVGGIPNELIKLSFLEVFNVSDNDLVGPVPTGKQFDTFLDSSYLENPGLCGSLLTNKCGNSNNTPSDTTPTEGSSDESSEMYVMKIGWIGCGCGMLAGLAMGYMLFWEMTPNWVGRLILKIEALVIVGQ